jgi:DNA repair protein RecN (Recombination protein N)
MLAHLRVSNLGVIEEAAIDPSPGFTVITGETGAGKTLLLGGLRLLLGGRVDEAGVGPYGEAACVDGLFQIGEEEVGVTRTIPREGRSRAHLEGSIVSAATLAERLGAQVEIVGQHDQLSLNRSSHLLQLVDAALDDEGRKAREAYTDTWDRLQTALARHAAIGGDPIELARELDLARYQAREISGAGLSPGLDEELEASVSRLRNVEEISDHLVETGSLAEQLTEVAGEIVARMRKAAGLDPRLASLASEAEAMAEVVAGVGRGARDALDHLDTDPTALEELEARLTVLGDLKRKYGRTLEEVIGFGERVMARVDELEGLIGEAERIETVLNEARRTVSDTAGHFSAARRHTCEAVASEMTAHLADLGLAGAIVELALIAVEPGPSGADRIELRFASDSRLEPGPVATVASGGELSRLVLALRLATRSATAATIVFDEVDTGIGGRTALEMGRKIARLAQTSQVLCVTHLPQVAAQADTHFMVERVEGGAATVRRVSGPDRVTEISRMLAGLPESEAGRSAAEELLATAAK